jgi:hypothetical protein
MACQISGRIRNSRKYYIKPFWATSRADVFSHGHRLAYYGSVHTTVCLFAA